MPRRARLRLPHVPLHIIQRGNNRQRCFYADQDYRFYLDWVAEYARKAGCRIHAYVLMTNHIHRPHELYRALGADDAARQAAYRELVRSELEPRLVDAIRRATNGNFALGDERFAARITAALGRRVVPGKSGRPRKEAEQVSAELFA